MNRANQIGIAAFFTIGAALLAASALSARYAWNLKAEYATHEAWPQVDAVVTETHEVRAQDGSYFTQATLAWTGPDGQTYTQTEYGSDGTGNVYRMRYDPANPAYVEGIDVAPSLFPTILLGAMGVAFTGIAARVALDSIRGPKPA